MLDFIDESGEPSFHDNHLSDYFVLSLLIFESTEDSKKCEIKLIELKNKLNFKTEFKFSKSCNKTRDEFFAIIQPLNFRVNAIVVEKALITQDYLKNNPKKFYNFFLKQLITNTPNLSDPVIIIDGKASKNLTFEIHSYLRREVSIKIKKLKFEDSKKNIFLQMSDMIASAIGYSYNRREKDNSQKWKETFRKKAKIWEFR